MPYWIQSTFAATPALVGMFLGLGLPWALVILPRRDWRDWPTVACLTLAFGPALLTTWMFILGSVGQPLLTLSNVLIGMAVLAVIGWALTWRKRNPPLSPEQGKEKKFRLGTDEKLLLALIGIALVVRWIGVAYWPSTAYDALWVYAYEGKLYTLLGYIPSSIGYYPQFLPLQHTFLQLAVGGVDDHAARAVLPWLHLGSIFAAYILGKQLFNRRTGIYVAAIWALYPHVGEWSRYGDLEIPVAFMFTTAAAFFLLAWKNARYEFPVMSPEDEAAALAFFSHLDLDAIAESQATKAEATKTASLLSSSLVRRYALIAGLLLGIGMWTKPTMGAFIWGVALLVGIEFIYRIAQANTPELGFIGRIVVAIDTTWPRVQVAVWTGIACIPLGAVWYLRNFMNGHQAIDLPPGYWQSLAAQSGVEFGWPLLALLILLAYIFWQRDKLLPVARIGIGLALIIAGVLPTIINTGKVGITDNRMSLLEWLALGAGSVLLFITLWRWAQNRWTEEGRTTASTLGWALALALPYFVTWFYSYSYHYRLSFAIVPLLILPTAVILAKWVKIFEPPRHQERRENGQEKTISSPVSGLGASSGAIPQIIFLAAIIALSIPGIIAPLYDVNAGWDWLWTDKLPDDHARYESGNVALMSVVDGLQIYKNEHPDTPMNIVAPGIKRLPFFFPLDDIRIGDPPADLKALEGMTYFIYGTPETGGDFGTLIPGHNPVLDVLSLATDDQNDFKSVLRRAWWKDDGIFKYTVYELHLDQRWEAPAVTIPPEGNVVFGDFVRYMGYDILDHSWWQGRKLTTNFFWEVLKPPPADYVVYIHLLDDEGNLWMAWDAPITRTEDGNYYSSLVWEPGEYIIDRRILKMTNRDTPIGEGYHVDIGLYDRATQERVPMTIDGHPAGDSFTLDEPFAMVPGEE
jgi:4-amino-4-deoxy-L-arabinose transferase-like glycosyltransferase